MDNEIIRTDQEITKTEEKKYVCPKIVVNIFITRDKKMVKVVSGLVFN